MRRCNAVGVVTEVEDESMKGMRGRQGVRKSASIIHSKKKMHLFSIRLGRHAGLSQHPFPWWRRAVVEHRYRGGSK